MDYILGLWRFLYDVVFPPSPAAKLVRITTPTEVLRLYRPQTVGSIITLLPYQNPLVRTLIHEAKFHYNPRAYTLLAAVLTLHLTNTEEALVTPVPLSSKRLRERGYNQSQEIVQRACKSNARLHVHTRALIRIIDTRPQTELTKTERLKNVKDVFKVPDRYHTRIAGSHIVIVDDVSTTGATLQAAATALRKHNPQSVTLLALAH